MKIRSLLVLILLVIGFNFQTNESAAGTARSLSLGSNPSYFHDSANILQWYSSLVSYPNQVEFELGDVLHGRNEALSNQKLPGHGGSVHVRPVDDGSWGIFAFNFQDHLKHGQDEGSFSALWARQFGALDLGLAGHFTTFGNSEVGTEIGDWVDSQYYHKFGLGLGTDLSENIHLEFSGEIVNSMAARSGALYNLTITDDWDTYGLRLRSFIQLNSHLTLVPMIDFLTETRTGLDTNGDLPVEIDIRNLNFGMGANLQAKEDLLLVFSSEYRVGRENLGWQNFNSGDYIWDFSENEYYHIRLRSGMEAVLLPWLKVRASAQYLRIHEDQHKYEEGGLERKYYRFTEIVSTPVTLGVGIQFGGMKLDLAYNDSAPLEGRNFYSEEIDFSQKGYSSVTISWLF